MIVHSISLKECSKDIVSQLKVLDCENFPFPWSINQWDQSTDNDSFYVFYLPEMSGFILYQLSPVEELAHLLKILIVSDHRNKGLASQMLAASHQNLKILGFKRVFLEVEDHNSAALRLYDHLGYKKIHFKKKFYSNGADAHIMEKHL